MPDTDIGSTEVSNLTDAFANQADVSVSETYKVDASSTEGAGSQKEFTWQMTEFSQNLGYYRKIPELKTAIDAQALWTLGAGYEAEEETTMLLQTIKGNGKDSFNSILKNMQKIKTLAGDSFSEIIRDEKNEGLLVNLKPLDPSSMIIVQNNKGKILRYEQVSKTKTPNKRFKPEKIFHLSRDRLADEIHGVSIIPSVEWIIKARNEAMADWKKVLHRNVSPLVIWHLDTDDETQIASFKAKNTAAKAGGEDMYIPKGTVVPEVVATAQNQTLNPLAWIAQLNDYFFQAVNVPQIIIGNAKEFTDASAKIVYLAYEQNVKAEQLYIEEQVLGQLNLEINLTFPTSLEQDTMSGTPNETDMIEEEPMEQPAQPNDTTAELEGNK